MTGSLPQDLQLISLGSLDGDFRGPITAREVTAKALKA